MSADQNKQLLRRIYTEVYTKGNLDTLDQLVAKNCIDHNPMPEQEKGLAGIRASCEYIRKAFPDLVVTPEILIAEGDKVACRWRARGTHRGEFLSYSGTGKTTNITGMDVVRVENGKIVEWFHNEDMFGLLQQLGVEPHVGGAQRGRPETRV